jgi:hypothetical protein
MLPGYTEPLRGLPRPALGQQPGPLQDPGQREMGQPGHPRHGRPAGEPGFDSGSGFDEDDFSDLDFDEADDIADGRYQDERRGNDRMAQPGHPRHGRPGGEPRFGGESGFGNGSGFDDGRGFDEDDFSDLDFDEADDIADGRYQGERRGNDRPLDERQSRRPAGGHHRRPEGTRRADERPVAPDDVYGGWSRPDDGASHPGRGRHRSKKLVIGGSAIAVAAAVAGTFVVSQLTQHQSDPGCNDYTADVLPDYNKMINDLNEQAKKPQLTADMTAAVNQLTAAEGKTQSAQATAALQALLAQLQTVQKDAGKGFVPAVTVRALNSAASKADNAC